MSEANSTAKCVRYKSLDFLGFPSYRINSNGKIQKYKEIGSYRKGTKEPAKWRDMFPTRQKSGHLAINLFEQRKSRTYYIHQLVLEAFVGPCPEGMEACHFPDKDPSNNRKENLKWGTPKENAYHKKLQGTEYNGERHHLAKLDSDKVREIRKLYHEDKWERQDIADKYRVCKSTITKVLARRYWKQVG